MDKLHSSVVFGSNSSDDWYDSIYTYIEAQNCNPVYGSVIGSAIVGLSGLVPLFLPLHDPQNASSSKIGKPNVQKCACSNMFLQQWSYACDRKLCNAKALQVSTVKSFVDRTWLVNGLNFESNLKSPRTECQTVFTDVTKVYQHWHFLSEKREYPSRYS